ncbi:MAG: peptidase MA family metallohydrolase [Myxococcota bacterium]
MRAAAILSAAIALCLAAPARAEHEDSDELRRAFAAIEAWRVDEAREVAERWYSKVPEDPAVLALVAEVKLHSSDYAGAVEFYTRAKEAGAPEFLLRSAPLAEAAAKETKGYEEHTTSTFVFRYAPGRDAVLVPYAEETAEKALEKLSDLLGWRPKSRVVLEFYPSTNVLADVSTLTREEIKASGTIALCKWNRLMVTTPRGVMLGYRWRDTIAHELAHLIIGGASKNSVPIWLHEGIAKYIETAWRDRPGLGLSVEQQKGLQDAAKKGKLIPFSKMHPSMAKLKSQEETSLAFAEVFTFIEYLVDLKGWEGIRAVFSKLAGGMSDAEAVAAVYGAPLTTLSDRWMASLKTRKIRAEGVDASAERPVVVKDRPDAPDDALHGVSKEGRRYARAADLLFARGRTKAAQKELEKALKAAPSPLLGAKLAVVALANRDLDGAENAARAALDGASDLAGPYLTLAEVLAERKKSEDALRALDHAASINPFDPRIAEIGARVANTEALKTRFQTAQQILHAGQQPAAELGLGGRIEVDATPFSRVFLTREGTTRRVATGMVTPTAPIDLKPGTYELRLVPPVGAPTTRAVTVQPARDGRAQRIEPDPRGS